MKLTNFIQEGSFYKANLHTHSTNSDGKLTQEEAVGLYKDNGYNFLCMSDHNKITKTDKYNDENFILIPGLELHSSQTKPQIIHHMLGLADMDNDKIQDGMWLDNIPFTENRESLLKLEKTLTDLDLLTIYCHPTWSHTVTSQFDFLQNTNIMEIFNWGTVLNNGVNHDQAQWDAWLRQGREIWGIACDDGHSRPQFLGGWIMAKCKDFSIKSFFESLKSGSFYSTSGPIIHDFYVEDEIAYVECSPAYSITFVTEGRWGKCYRDPVSMMTKAQYELSSLSHMVRVEVKDMSGKTAWSNPIVMKDKI